MFIYINICLFIVYFYKYYIFYIVERTLETPISLLALPLTSKPPVSSQTQDHESQGFCLNTWQIRGCVLSFSFQKLQYVKHCSKIRKKKLKITLSNSSPKKYFKYVHTSPGKALRSHNLCSPQGPTLARVPCVSECSAVIDLEFLTIYQEAPHVHFILGPTHYAHYAFSFYSVIFILFHPIFIL